MDVDFPDDYGAQHLAGKQAVFTVRVLGVSEPILPDVDSAFAKAFGVEDGSVDTLRADIRSNMEREASQAIASQVKRRVMDVLLEAHKIDVPRGLVDREIRRMQEQATSQVKASGRTQNFALPRDLFADQAQRRVALGLILGEIVRTHHIEVDAARVRAKVEEFASTYEEPDEVVKWYYGNREQLAGVESMVHEDQVVDWTLEQVNVTERSMTFDELMASRDKS
jgi:trigger factor